jgi:hypothetical protein
MRRTPVNKERAPAPPVPQRGLRGNRLALIVRA